MSNFVPNNVSISPRNLKLIERKDLPDGPRVYPFFVNFSEPAPGPTDNMNFTIPGLNPQAFAQSSVNVFDLSSVQSTVHPSPIRSLMYSISSGWNPGETGGNIEGFGPVVIFVPETGEIIVIPLTVSTQPGVQGTTGYISSFQSGVIPILSSQATKIYIVKTPDVIVGGGFVNGWGNFVAANYELPHFHISNSGWSNNNV